MTILLVALFPLAWTLWESVHLHDLRMPWLGRPFVGLNNYLEAFGDPRFRGALGHTAFFAVASVTLELVIGLWLALALNRAFRFRGLVRAAVLVPWAIPTVVSAAGATGLDLEDGREALIAQDDDQFVDKVVQLYGQERLWNAVQGAAQHYIRRHYSPGSMRKQLADVLAT